jgi:imidazole glycerol-phosphate synthase subunit HisH
MRITLFDYGAGNLHSLAKALSAPGVELRVEADPLLALDTGLLVLPGVGAFGAAAARLAPGREAMRTAVAQGLPCLGRCRGRQLLFEGSDEGPGEGLGLFRGRATRLRSRRVPHIGWNSVEGGETGLASAYYANSYACRPESPGEVSAWTEYEGDRFPAVVRRGKLLGVQFHPEKSSSAGVRFLQSFLSEVCA